MKVNRRRLHLLLLLLAATIALSFYYDRSSSTAMRPHPGRTSILPVFQSEATGHASTIPTIHQLPPPQEEANTTTPHRNLFRYADVPPAPKYVPPPPPPPPEIKPESRFLGTLDEGHLHALFGFKGDVLPLKEGDTLEGKYLVKQVDIDSVLLEDPAHGNTRVLTLVKK